MGWGGPWFMPIASLGAAGAEGMAGMELKAAMASSSAARRHRVADGVAARGEDGREGAGEGETW